MTLLGRPIIPAIACIIFVSVSARAETPVTACDRLAAHPYDPKKTADGVEFADLDADEAIPACWDAIREYGAEPRFQYQLGRAYDKSGNLAHAIVPFRKAVERGYAMAALILGHLYASGQVEGVDEVKARREAERLLRRAIDGGIIEARFELASRLSRGAGVRKDSQVAEDILMPVAEAGVPQAQYELGRVYAVNEQLADNESRAVHWYERSASRDYAPAQYQLAQHFISGKGVGKDIGRAVALLTAAAAHGNPDAQSRLGQMYLSGEHIEKDFDRAFELLENASVAGNQDAYWIVRRAYQQITLMQSLDAPVPTYSDPPPEGLEMFAAEAYGRNSLQMMTWLRRMSAAGSGEAANALASFYAMGINVPKDRDRAAELYMRAIALGYEKARNGLNDLQMGD
jgi:TPR repeat protein